MRLHLTIVSFFTVLSFYANGQRIVNRLFFIFPKTTLVDTLRKNFPRQFILTLESPVRLSGMGEENSDAFPKDAKNFFQLSPSDVHWVDSLMKVSMLKAVIAGDSLLYVNNQIYTWHNDKPSDFYKYSANRNKLYQRLARENWMKIKKSDKYYFGYVNHQDKKRIVVLFDPKKIKYKRMGNVNWFDFCEPFAVDKDTKSSSFGYFPM